jgi:hypothetical protein
MAITRDQLISELYYRENGRGRRLCKCRQCGAGPMSVRADVVSSEPCDECGAVDWRDLTEGEFISESDLSAYLTLHSKYLISEMENLHEVADSEEWRRVLKKLVEGLEGFSDAQTASWLRANLEKHPKIMEYVLDEFYVRRFLKSARKMVDRTMKLSAMTPRATPNPEVNVYLREATRCWIAGLWQSSVALSRTTLEIALRNRLKEGHGFLPTDDKFETVIEYAYMCRVIDHAHHEMAEDVRKRGNGVVHGSPANEDLAARILSNTRGILHQLYSE